VAFEQVFFGGGELRGTGRGVRGPQRGSRGGRFEKSLQRFQFGASCVQPGGLWDAVADRPGAGCRGGFGQVAVSRAAGARGRAGLARRRRRRRQHRARRYRLPLAAGPPGRPHGAAQLPGPGPGPRAQPQMVSEQHGEEEQGRQGQSPSLRPLRIGARFVALPGSPAAAAAADSQRGGVFPGPHPSAPEHISGGSGLEGVGRREAGRPSREGGLRTAPRSSAPSRLYLGGRMARQAGRPGAPLRPLWRGALGPSPRPSRAPLLAAGAPPPGPLGAARRPGGGRCGALGRWRLRRRRRTPHGVGPLRYPGLRATSLRAPGPLARTLLWPSVSARRGSAPLSAAVRAPPRSTPLPSPAPLLSRPSARCPLPAPCSSPPRSCPPRPAGRSAAGPSGFPRALAVRWGRSRAGSALAPHPRLPEFRLGRATWLPAAPQTPDADARLYLVRLSLPPLLRPAVAAAQRHGPVAPAGHAPSVCRHLPLCGEHLESPCASVFGGEQGGERGTGRRRERDWGPDCACASGLPPPQPQPPPAAACAVWGCFQSTPNSIHFGASVHPTAPRVHTPHAESQAWRSPSPTKRPLASLPRTAPRSPPRAKGLLRVILRSRGHLLRFLLPLWVASPSSSGLGDTKAGCG
jgi:hypothetical protein